MRRTLIVLLHLGYWVIYLFLLSLVLALSRSQHPEGPTVPRMLFSSPLGLLWIVPNLAAFYTAYTVLFSRFLAHRRILALVIAAVVVSVTFGAVGFFGLPELFSGPAFPPAGRDVWAGPLMAVTFFALIHMTIALVMRGFVVWYDDLKVKEELTRRNHETEMALIRSKLDPHFLFNTLNNIDVLIAKDPATASAYLNRLSDIMRFVLYEASAPAIPLAAELAYIEKYVALQRLRMANPRSVTYEVHGSDAGLSIAPMLFIPFIENAFKHVEPRKVDGAIAIRLDIEGRRVTFQCRNLRRRPAGTGPGQGGLGKDLIARRVALAYPGRHRLDIGDHDDHYSVSLTLDLDDHALHHR